jgi:predicted TPR repeat methyltransferase
VSGSPADRVRNLLLRGDNQLKHGRAEKAVEAFEEALTVASADGSGVEPRVVELVERRLASARELGAGG